MHWFLEQIKNYYPLEIRDIQDLKSADTDLLMSVLSAIEHGDIFVPKGNKSKITQLARTKLDGPGFVLSTSGTTGRPKLALYSFDRFLEKFRGVAHNPNLFTLMIMEPDHIGGMDVLFSVISRGGDFCFPDTKTPEGVCDAIQENGIEFISLSPTFLNLILLSGCPERYDLTSLRTINFGAEPMPAALLERLKDEFPYVEFRQTFGTTETGTVKVERHPSDPLLIKIPDSKIVNSKLYVKSDYGMVCYLDADSPFDSDGYFPTGDIVERHGEYIKILGRETDDINIGGEKVLLTEVENILLQVPGVADVRVSSEKNLIVGNILKAEVVWHSNENCKEYITSYLKGTVEKHRIPTKFKVVHEIAYSDRLKKVRK